MDIREIVRESTGKITRNSRLQTMVYKAYRGTLIKKQTLYYPEAMDIPLLEIPS